MNLLQAKTAFVTGAASGIGRASALLFAAEGACVVALDRAPEVEATVAAIRAAGGRAIALVQDSSVEEHVASAIAAAVEEFGSLDVCFANAGISGGLVPFFEETAERWAQILQINLIGTFLAAKHAALTMTKQRRGSIICTASVAGLRSGAGCMPYSASKAGVISLVQTAANELAGTGVRVNAIAPGPVYTPTPSGPEFIRALGETTPMRRASQPEEIAEVIAFLASPRARAFASAEAVTSIIFW